MMGNDTKRAKNSHGSGNNPNASDGSDRSNQGHGGNNQNQGNQGNTEVVTKATKKVVEVSRGWDISPIRTKTRVLGPVVGVIDTTPHRETSPSFRLYRSGSR